MHDKYTELVGTGPEKGCFQGHAIFQKAMKEVSSHERVSSITTRPSTAPPPTLHPATRLNSSAASPLLPFLAAALGCPCYPWLPLLPPAVALCPPAAARCHPMAARWRLLTPTDAHGC